MIGFIVLSIKCSHRSFKLDDSFNTGLLRHNREQQCRQKVLAVDRRDNLSDHDGAVFMVSLPERPQSALFQPMGLQFVFRIPQDHRPVLQLNTIGALLAVVIPPLFVFFFLNTSLVSGLPHCCCGCSLQESSFERQRSRLDSFYR